MTVEPATALPPQGTCEHGQGWASLHAVREAWAGSGQGQVCSRPLPWLACGSPMTHGGTPATLRLTGVLEHLLSLLEGLPFPHPRVLTGGRTRAQAHGRTGQEAGPFLFWCGLYWELPSALGLPACLVSPTRAEQARGAKPWGSTGLGVPVVKLSREGDLPSNQAMCTRQGGGPCAARSSHTLPSASRPHPRWEGN